MTSGGRLLGGRYRLDAVIGSGGMGVVWRAFDERLHRAVAVKEVRFPSMVSAEERADLTRRAMIEARSAARLDHPHIVAVYDVVDDDDRPWIVMRLVEGRSLDQVIAEIGPLDPLSVTRLGLALVDALATAHAAGVLHRDVKPSNVLIQADGRVLLTDFSIAVVLGSGTLTKTGVLLGSPGYIAPERLRAGAVGPPADLFGLGATLYYAIEGRGPFDSAEPLAGLFATATDPHPRPVRAGALTEVLDALLTKDPGTRWDAATTRAALQALTTAPGARPGAIPATLIDPLNAATVAAAFADQPGTHTVPAPGAARRGPGADPRRAAPTAADGPDTAPMPTAASFEEPDPALAPTGLAAALVSAADSSEEPEPALAPPTPADPEPAAAEPEAAQPQADPEPAATEPEAAQAPADPDQATTGTHDAAPADIIPSAPGADLASGGQALADGPAGGVPNPVGDPAPEGRDQAETTPLATGTPTVPVPAGSAARPGSPDQAAPSAGTPTVPVPAASTLDTARLPRKQGWVSRRRVAVGASASAALLILLVGTVWGGALWSDGGDPTELVSGLGTSATPAPTPSPSADPEITDSPSPSVSPSPSAPARTTGAPASTTQKPPAGPSLTVTLVNKSGVWTETCGGYEIGVKFDVKVKTNRYPSTLKYTVKTVENENESGINRIQASVVRTESITQASSTFSGGQLWHLANGTHGFYIVVTSPISARSNVIYARIACTPPTQTPDH